MDNLCLYNFIDTLPNGASSTIHVLNLHFTLNLHANTDDVLQSAEICDLIEVGGHTQQLVYRYDNPPIDSLYLR